MKPRSISIRALCLCTALVAASIAAPPGSPGQDAIVEKRVVGEPRRQKEAFPLRPVPAFEVLESSDSRVVVRFEMPPFEIERAYLPEYWSITCRGSHSTQEPGLPDLPAFSTRVAVPPAGDVRVSFSPGRSRQLGSYRIVPFPAKTGTDDIGALLYEYAYADSFARMDTYPAALFTAREPSFMRRQRAVGVTVFPVQVDPERMTLTFLEEATIEIAVDGSAAQGGAASPGTDAFGSLYHTSVVNPGDSERWLARRKQPAPALSIFHTGEDWVKVKVRQEGMYRVTYSDLFELGVDPAGIDPSSFQMYYLGGMELPPDIVEERPEMREIAVKIIGAEDGSFDSGDMIVFYGQSLSRWISPDEYHSHRYTYDNVYWITWGNPQAVPLRMDVVDVSPGGAAEPVETTRLRSHFEQNTEYVTDEESGYLSVPDDWIWQEISGTPGIREEARLDFNLDNLAGGGTDSIRVEVYGVPTFTSHKVHLFINDRYFHEIRFSSRFAHRTAWLPLEPTDLREGTNTLKVVLPKDEPSVEEDAIYFGWFEVSTLRRLDDVGGGIVFQGRADEDDYIYVLEGTTLTTPLLFDATDPFSPAELTGFETGAGVLEFEDRGVLERRRYALTDRSLLKLPSSVELRDSRSLKESGKGADYVILTGPELLSQAQRLAEFRREENGFRTEIVTTDAMYDEFSGGLVDVTAIRDFLLWAYENWDPAPAWAVLFGDGHLDYKEYTTFGQNKASIMPPHVDRDLAIDDWFVRLDAGYDPDMFYGRLTAKDLSQAKVAVDKIIDYERNPEFGAWRSRVIILADDCFRNRNCETLPHTGQSEDVDRRIPAEFKRVKVYLVDFPFDPPETGDTKPAATEYLIEQWNRGAILLNYVGHGSPNRWAHEKAFLNPTHTALLKNKKRLPLVIAASCSIGHFDHFLYDGMVEDLMTEPGKGAIASFAATRVTYPDPNRDMNNAFVDTLFRDPHSPPFLGEATVKAKIAIPGGNSRRYTLFGDPATKLAFPDMAVSETEAPDSLVPLGTMSYRGEILSGDVRDPAFDGYAQVDVFDPPRRRIADECECVVTSYWDTGRMLFTGSVPVTAGELAASFIVPGNIPSSIPADSEFTQNSRIYVYAWTGQEDAYGVVDSIPLSQVAIETGDTIPPEFFVRHLGSELRDAENIPAGTPLSIELSDPSGINLTAAPGFQILVELDEGRTFRTDMTGAFQYDVGSHEAGSLEFILPDVAAGPHLLSFRATDNALNTGRQSVQLNITEEEILAFENALVYPNPFSSSCTITFDLSSPAIVTAKIFTTGGRLIRTIRHSGNTGFNSFLWDGTDRKGDRIANGAYLIKLVAQTPGASGSNNRAEAMLKALLLK